MFKPNDRIIVVSDWTNPDSAKEYTVTKVSKDTLQCGSPENTFYSAMCWPASAKNEIMIILQKREAIKRQLDDSFKMVYELRNKLINTGIL